VAEFSSMEGEWPKPLMVMVNGKERPTQLYEGVQRFVPDPAVERLVNLCLDSFGLYGRPGRNFYEEIPASLKGNSHDNPVVNHIVEANRYGYYGLNEVVLSLHDGTISVSDWIDFQTLHGGSLGYFYDSVTSQLSNLGLGVPYIDPEDGEAYEDFSEYFTLDNPLWEE